MSAERERSEGRQQVHVTAVFARVDEVAVAVWGREPDEMVAIVPAEAFIEIMATLRAALALGASAQPTRN